MSELSGKQVKSYSVGFVDGAGDPRNEMPYARLAAQHFGTDHHELMMTGQQYADGLQDFVQYMEEPMADPSSIPLYYLSQLARKIQSRSCCRVKGVTNCWLGIAFGNRCKDIDGLRRYHSIPRPIRRWAIKPFNDLFFRSPQLARYLESGRTPALALFSNGPRPDDAYLLEEMKEQLYGRHGRE